MIRRTTLALPVLAAVLALPAIAAAQQPLPITDVLLYKNGMAYVVRSGEILEPLRLTFHPEDMNDVLKSFSAWNPDTGELYSVGYTTGIPSSYALSRFPFDISNPDMGLGGFLIQVKGAELGLDNTEGSDVRGKLVAVERDQRVTAPDTSPTTDYRLTVLLDNGSLESVWLGDVGSIEFSDPLLREQLRTYLAVLAEGRQDVTREVTVYPGPSPGPIRVAYLQQFPLWKTSYRIDLGDDDARVQGWAQIDNPTGESWDDVEVSLLSGNPVSFIMNLYDPLYTSRTTVPVPGGQVAAPRIYESATSRTEDLAARAALDGFASPTAPPAALERGGRGGRGGGGAFAAGEAVAVPFVFQEAATAEVADFFEYRFPFPVQLASRQSALLPFVQRTMDAERLSIFNASADRGNPRLGARIANDTDIPLDSGPVTFFQQTRYAGEAVLEYLPPGDERLVSYGVDYDIQVSNRQDSRPERTTRLTINDGIVVQYRESTLNTTYEIRNRGTEAKTLVVEHPRLANRTLSGIDPFESTDSFHRFRVDLAGGEATDLLIPEVLERQTRITLQTLTRQQLVTLTGPETPQSVRNRLGEIVEVQEEIAALREEIRTAETRIETLFRDQERLRENLRALGDGSADLALRTRYLDQLTGQEDAIDADRAAIAETTVELAETAARLGALISSLSFSG